MASSTEPNRNKSYDPKNAHITEQQITRSNWYKHVNWLNIVLILGVPFIGCVKAATTPLQLWTAVFAVAYYFATGLGITAGYHRQGLRKSRHNTKYANCLHKAMGTHLVLSDYSSEDIPRVDWSRGCRGIW